MYRKIVGFGKVDFNHSGRKNCAVTVEVEIKDGEKGPGLSICGNVWNPRRTDCYSCRQNIDPDGQAEVRPVSPWLRNRVMAEPYLKLVSRRR